MNSLPPIGAKVRLSAVATERLARSPGRARDVVIGEVVGSIPAAGHIRAIVQWPNGSPPESLHPMYLELAT